MSRSRTNLKLKEVPAPEPLLRLDLGAGQNKRDGFKGVDLYADTDFKVDLFKFPWSFADNSVEEIHCAHFFEHVPRLLRGKFMEEVYRILVPKGKAQFITPHYGSVRAVQDFTHEWPPLGENSYLYFNKQWRIDNKLTHGPYDLKCDFDFCVAPDTLVLKSDLMWVRADSIQIGDRLVGVEEYPKAGGLHRRTVESVVEFTRVFESRRVRVTSADASVVATPEHPFLARSRHASGRKGTSKWIEAAKLKRGDAIKFFGSPWIKNLSDSWVSGLFDGEGCIVLPTVKNRYTGLSLTISQNPGPVLDRAVDELRRELDYSAKVHDKAKDRLCKSAYVCGIAPSLRALGTYRPIRLLPKMQEIIRSGKLGLPSLTSEVVAVAEEARGPVVAIRTSSRTLITNGLVSHNTYGFSMSGVWTSKNEETRTFAAQHYRNVADDLHVSLVSRKPEVK